MGRNADIPNVPGDSQTGLSCALSDLILSSIREAVILTDENGIVTYWNRAATQLFGWSADEMLGRPYSDRYPPGQREWITAQIQERVAGVDWEGEYEDLHKDGRRVWIHAVVRRIFRPDGSLAGVLGVSQDITSERQAKRAAAAERALERALIDSMPANIAVLDAQGTIRAVNRAWADFSRDNAPLGRSEAVGTGIGVNYLDVLRRTGGLAELEQAIVEVLGGMRAAYSSEYPCHSPSALRWFRMTVTPLGHADGGAVVSHTDITERVRSEASSRQDSERLQLALSAAQMGVWSLDVANGELSCSPEVGQILKRAGFADNPALLCQRVHPEDTAAINLQLSRCITERGRFEGVFRLLREDGVVRWLHNFAQAQLGPDGAPQRVVGTLQDISELRAARLATLRQNEILQRIAQATPLPEVLADIARMLEEQFPGTTCAIWLHDAATHGLQLQAAPSLPESLRSGLSVLPGQPAAGAIEHIGITAHAQHAADAPADGHAAVEVQAAPHGLHARVGLPLLSGGPGRGEPLGQLVIYSRSTDDADGLLGALHAAAQALLGELRQDPQFPPRMADEADRQTSARSLSKVLANALHLARLAIESQQALHELQASEERFRQLVEGMRDHAVFLVDPTLHIRAWSPGAARIFGYSAKQILGQHAKFLLPPADRSVLLERSLSELATEKRVSLEDWVMRADGSQFWASTVVNALSEASGALRGYVVVTSDLTEQRRTAQKLLQAQRLDAIARLAGGVAHDFNNLLLIIKGYADLLSPLIAENSISSEAVLAIRDAGDRAAALTRQLLAFSSSAHVVPRTLDLNAAVESARRMLQRLMGEDIQLTTQLDRGLGAIRFDPAQFDQLLLNLAVHAREAMPVGGALVIGTQRVAVDEKTQLDFGTLPPGLYAQLSIKDSGHGIPEDVRLHLFEPFYRNGDSSGEIGLGLASVYGIVRQAGGAIRVDSTPTNGTTFRIFLPMLAEATRATQNRPAALPRGSETLLIVEEDAGIRQLIHLTLRMLGYQVLLAATPQDGLALAASHQGPIHVLILDTRLASQSNAALPATLLKGHPQLRVLILGQESDDAHIRRSAPPTDWQFLAMPFTPQALASTLRELLERPQGLRHAP